MKMCVFKHQAGTEKFKQILQDGVEMVQADVREDMLLYIPWGWLVFEKVSTTKKCGD